MSTLPHRERVAWILRHLEVEAAAAPLAERPSELTVGLELEAFLLDQSGRPADQSASQRVFRRVAEDPAWTADFLGAVPDRDFLPSVRRPEKMGGETVLKYDHAPHLIEIATGPFDSLVDLGAALHSAVRSVDSAAKSLDLTMRFQPQLTGPLPESPLPLFQRLRQTRRKARAAAGMPRRRRAENYAAGIAAVQLHVGGLNWGRRLHWMERLHGFEPALLGQLSGTPAARSRMLRRRWLAYRDAFPGNPLIGFPNLPNWTLSNWAEALAATPLLIDDTATDDKLDWHDFRFRVRDLQIIRPRAFGTVEFRADPMQPTLAGNLRMAALRLGLSAAMFSDQPPGLSFRAARAAWWSAALGEIPVIEERSVVDEARSGLAARGRGEEALLDDA